MKLFLKVSNAVCCVDDKGLSSETSSLSQEISDVPWAGMEPLVPSWIWDSFSVLMHGVELDFGLIAFCSIFAVFNS